MKIFTEHHMLVIEDPAKKFPTKKCSKHTHTHTFNSKLINYSINFFPNLRNKIKHLILTRTL